MEAPLITQLVEQMAIMGATADMRICSPTTATQMQCLPTRLESRIAPQASRFIGAVELPMSRAFRGESGTDIFVNYRHKRSIGAYGPLGNTGLGVVVQQDTEDTYAPIRAPFQTLLLYLAILVGGTILLLRWQVAPLVRKAVAAQADSKANAARIAAIMNSVPDGIITIDMEGAIVSANPAVTNLFGYPNSELVGKNVRMLMPAGMRARHEQGLGEHRESGRKNIIGKGTVEISALRNDNREFTM
jgi:PAS domain S-box-containing protein